MNNDNINRNLNMSLAIVVITNILSAIVFFVAYGILKETAFLIVGIINIVLSIAFFFFIRYFQNKINTSQNKSNKYESNI